MTTKTKKQATVNFNLKIGDDVLAMNATVPDARVSALDMMPAFQHLTNQAVAHSIDLTTRKGKTISCKAGCGACCKQPVPVTLIEVEHLSRLVKNMPRQRQQRIRDTFKHHLDAINEAGLLEEFSGISEYDTGQKRQLAKQYFELGLDCPFLENQSCGIYEDRPLQCREFLVTSDPRHCAELDPDGIEHVEQPMSMARGLTRLGKDSLKTKNKGWVLMIFALDLAKSGRLRFKKKWGKEWLESYVRQVIGKG